MKGIIKSIYGEFQNINGALFSEKYNSFIYDNKKANLNLANVRNSLYDDNGEYKNLSKNTDNINSDNQKILLEGSVNKEPSENNKMEDLSRDTNIISNDTLGNFQYFNYSDENKNNLIFERVENIVQEFVRQDDFLEAKNLSLAFSDEYFVNEKKPIKKSIEKNNRVIIKKIEKDIPDFSMPEKPKKESADELQEKFEDIKQNSQYDTKNIYEMKDIYTDQAIDDLTNDLENLDFNRVPTPTNFEKEKKIAHVKNNPEFSELDAILEDTVKSVENKIPPRLVKKNLDNKKIINSNYSKPSERDLEEMNSSINDAIENIEIEKTKEEVSVTKPIGDDLGSILDEIIS